MTFDERINDLTLALMTELRYYAEKVMKYKLEEEVNSFIDGYFECIAITDHNPNEQHQIASLENQISEIKRIIEFYGA